MDLWTIVFEESVKITQDFWNNFIWNWKNYYSQFGLKWHNWVDYSAKIWTKIFSPISWVVSLWNQWKTWYWKYIKITNYDLWLEIIYWHLSEFSVKHWDIISQKTYLWKTWNTWWSTWPHLHFGLKQIDDFWNILNKDNWFQGWIDPILYFKNLDTMKTNIGIYDNLQWINLFNKTELDKQLQLTAWDVKKLIEIAFKRYEENKTK